MGLLNYTTQISVDKTVGEIQSLLAKSGATSILTDYDDIRKVRAISFKIQTRFGLVAYYLPCKPEEICTVLTQQAREGEIPKKFLSDMEQASRVGWRIIKDWLEAQLAIVATKMVELEQVFLPYAQTDNGETLYERMVENRFNGLMIEGPRG